MSVRNLPLVIVLLVGLVACQDPVTQLESDVPQEQGGVVFSFSPPPPNVSPDFYEYPEGFRPGLVELVLSLQTEDGTPYRERATLALTPTSTGYQSAPLKLPPGTYRVVEAFAVNALQVTKFAVPVLNSPYAKVGPDFDQDWPGALPVTVEVAEDVPNSFTLATRPTNFSSEPAEYGYTSFASPLPEPSSSGITVRAVDPEGNPIPSFLWSHSITKDSSGGASLFGWGIRSGVLKNHLPSLGGGGNSGLRGLAFVRFQLGAFGYRDSEQFLKDSQDVYLHRLNDPTYTVVLQPEATFVQLRQAGTNDQGLPLVKARITSSQFIEEAFNAAGATATDKYQFFVGFELGTRVQGDLTPEATNQGSELFYFAPYNSQLVQARNDYKTLEATLVLKDPAALAQLLDSANGPLAQLYLEVAAFKGDGKTVFDSDDEILVSEQKVLSIGSHQISWAP